MLARRLDSLPFYRLRDEMDRVFGNLFAETPLEFVRGRAFPAINVWEDEHNLYAEAEVPGLSMSDIEVSVTGPELTLRGKRVATVPENATLHWSERGTGEFTRVLTLPIDIDADKVSATLQNGILSITLPKASSARARRIEVQSKG